MSQASRLCETCKATDFRPYKNHRKLSLELCKNCGFIRCRVIPSQEDLNRLYSQNYYVSWGINDAEEWGSRLKQRTFHNLLDTVETFVPEKKKLLDIGCATGLLIGEAERKGWDIYGIDVSSYSVSVAQTGYPDRVVRAGLFDDPFPGIKFQVVTMTDMLEHERFPREFLDKVKERLEPNGIIVITTPNTQSLTGKLFGGAWHHIKEEHLYYWSHKNIKRMLTAAGFKTLASGPFKKTLNLQYIKNQIRAYPNAVTTPASRILELIPSSILRREFTVSIGETILIAKIS